METTGITVRGNSFRARITISGKNINLGSFKTFKEAQQAYQSRYLIEMDNLCKK